MAKIGLGHVLKPAVDHIVNPVTQGVGTGAQKLGPPTQAAVALIGDGANTLVHGVGLTLNNILGGAGTGVYNTAPAASSVVDSLQQTSLLRPILGSLL